MLHFINEFLKYYSIIKLKLEDGLQKPNAISKLIEKNLKKI